ncbi:MAG: hypothetical protein M9936_08260 [Caldilinea sp.]|nr:hypothetical protein [Caldilinea sp.]
MPTQPPPADRSIQRTEALIDLAAGLGRRSANVETGRRRTALLTLRTLAAFARQQFAFLRAGLAPGGPYEGDDRYPLEFLLEATSRQVSFDVDVLLRAISHRDEGSSTPAGRATLALADSLALDAIELAVRHGLVERTVLLSYFQKSPTIRLIPYAPLAVIGFDFSATGDNARLLAIAHETGHHVYRQITVNYAGNVDAQIEAAAAPAPDAGSWPAWLLAWQEEIFADIYSALVAGPVAALGLQQIIQTGMRASLVNDDGDHPLDALRPEILHATLRAMAAQGPAARRKQLTAAADFLDQRWLEILAARGAPVAFVPAGEREALPLAEAGALLRSFVTETLSSILAPLAADSNHLPWSEGVAGERDQEAVLYAQFDATCTRVAGRALPELALRDRGKVLSVVGYPVEGRGGERVVGGIGDVYLDEVRAAGIGGAALTAAEWKAVFLAGDWVTEEGGSGITPVTRRVPPGGTTTYPYPGVYPPLYPAVVPRRR